MTDTIIVKEFIKTFLDIKACYYENEDGELFDDNGDLVVSTIWNKEAGHFVPPIDVDGYEESPIINISKGGVIENVQLPNRIIKRPKGLWFEVFWIPSSGKQAELGKSGRNLYMGIMQVNINVGLDMGTDVVDFAYEQIAKAFRHGEYFNGVRVIAPTSRASARTLADYYSTPVSIFLEALLEN